MATLIEVVARKAQQTFTRNFGDELFIESLNGLRALVNNVRPEHVNLSRELLAYSNPFRKSIPVTYVNLYENEVFSMGIFIIKDRAKIPLHDHPKMYGVLKVLHGTLKISSYNHIGVFDRAVRLPKELKHLGKKREFLPCKRNEDLEATVENEPCILTPTENNLHEIRSVGGPAAFLDILAPPYDMDERDCHYYERICEQVNEQPGISWLKEVSAPSEFLCDSEPYSGPGIDLDKG